MAIISSANLLALCDNLAKVCLDIQTAFVTGPTTGSPNFAQIQAGLVGNAPSAMARIATLGDPQPQLVLEVPANLAMQGIISLLAGTLQLAPIYLQFAPYCDALDKAVNGLANYLVTNSLMVHPQFANAFNTYTANVVSLGLRGTAPASIAPAQTFPATTIDPLATIVVTGTVNGTFAAGFMIASASYGAVPLTLYNVGPGATAKTTSFSMTYQTATGNLATTTFTGATGLAAGASVTTGISGLAVTNLSVTANGTAGETYAVRAPLLRTVTY